MRTTSSDCRGRLVAKDFFDVLRLQPEQGRSFARHELERTSQVVILSQGNSTRLFGANQESIGGDIRVNSWKNFPDPRTETLIVLGVMPADIRFLPATTGVVQKGAGVNDVLDYLGPAAIGRVENTDAMIEMSRSSLV